MPYPIGRHANTLTLTCRHVSLRTDGRQPAPHAQRLENQLESEQGLFTRSIVPVRDIAGLPLLAQDETIRLQATPQTLAELDRSFAMMGAMGFDATALRKYTTVERIEHVHHAGNSSGTVRVNVNGGAIAMGHPLRATGCINLGTLLDELERREPSTGCVMPCVGGGGVIIATMDLSRSSMNVLNGALAQPLPGLADLCEQTRRSTA